jgi:uncharacterized phiE125 gp8 family phage protein
MSTLSLITAPAAEPITLAEAKLHLKINADVTAEDSLIAPLIVTARDYVEGFTHRALPLQTWDLLLDGFPGDGAPIRLPKAPAVSVTSVTYIAPDGTSTVWSSALYTTDLPAGPKARSGCIVPAYGEFYPLTRAVPRAVSVRFVAGYAGTPVPVATLTQAAGLATATVTAGHGLTNLQNVTIVGAVQAGYNGTFVATVLNATQFTFPVVSTTVSPATGTITATPDPVPIMLKVCMLEHVRAHYGRGAEDRGEILQWIDRNLWAYKSF